MEIISEWSERPRKRVSNLPKPRRVELSLDVLLDQVSSGTK